MAILASLPPHHNLFSSLPKTPQPPHPPPSSHQPPIPIPKYPPKPKPKPKPNHPSFTKIPHTRTKYYKPISPTTPHKITLNQETPHKREIIIGQNGVSYLLPDAPFEYQFSYSEVPKAKPLAIREPPFLPFAPPSMPRPWTGKAPLLSKKQKELKKMGKKIPLFKSGDDGLNVKLEMGREFEMGEVCLDNRSRDEIIGAPLSRAEIKSLVTPLLSDNRQVNLGRDGLTHNMLELIHSHWKRQKVCKVKCKGVPTVDMDNVCNCLEDKTGGKIIHRSGGVVYLFRGRNYNYRTRPKYPIMLWKPAAPVYPKLIQDAPEGLTKHEADVLRRKGKKLLPICKLAKNGVYISLVDDVKHAFEGSELVKIDCRGLDPSDYKKIGAKLMELVPCVLLSFDEEQILMWRGRDWKSMYPDMPMSILPSTNDDLDDPGKSDNDLDASQPKIARSSPRMMLLWKRAIDSKKALLLSETDVGPDALLQKVEEFKGISQAMEHSYPAMLISNEDGTSNLASQVKVSKDNEEFGDLFGGAEYDEYDEFEEYESDPLEEADNLGSIDSLPIDHIAKRLLNQ